jgi:hypothetical protein
VGESWVVVHHDPDIHEKTEDGTSARQPNHHFHVVGVGVPLTALVTYESERGFAEAKLDAALPGVRRNGALEFVDLDLDVIVEADGSYWTRDLTTFEVNREALGYTPEVERAAYEGMRLGLRLTRTGAYPLGGALDATFAECLERSRAARRV